jgi:predicted phosphodiesterase
MFMKESKTVKNVGEKKGKLLFFGGVYSNLQALEELKKWAETNGYKPENIFCTGDVLGYCAQPVECIRLLQQWNIHIIAGNVEVQIRNDEDDCGCDFNSGGRCDLFSRNWYAYTKSKIDSTVKSWLFTLPGNIQFSFENKKITLVHGSWFYTSEYIFKSTPWSRKQENFEATQSDIIIGGHSGLPFADTGNNCTWINAGAIGMPANDGTTKVWFVTMQDEEGKPLFQFRELEYDHQTTAKLMRDNNLPEAYAKTLSTGLWDNCEILPAEEITKQGKRIVAETLHL